MLDHLLALFSGHTALLSNDVTKDQVHLAGHVSGITTDVEVGLLLQKLTDKRGLLLEAVLNVHLLGTLAGEGGDDLERIAHLSLPGL